MLEPNQNKLSRCYELFNFLLKDIIDTPVSLGLIWELDRWYHKNRIPLFVTDNFPLTWNKSPWLAHYCFYQCKVSVIPILSVESWQIIYGRSSRIAWEEKTPKPRWPQPCGSLCSGWREVTWGVPEWLGLEETLQISCFQMRNWGFWLSLSGVKFEKSVKVSQSLGSSSDWSIHITEVL